VAAVTGAVTAAAPWWVVAGVLAGGLVVGVLLSRRLVAAGYRLDDEQHRRVPGPAWTAAAAVPVLWGLLAWRIGGLAAGAVLPAYLLFSVVAVALFWIDLDVHRLPEGLTLPSFPAVLALLAVAAVTTGDWTALLRAVLCAIGLWLVYLVLALISPGALGLGDATLGGLVGLTLGFLDWRAPLVATAAAFVLGGAVSLVLLAARRVTRKTQVAFGPYILLGALTAVVVPLQVPGG